MPSSSLRPQQDRQAVVLRLVEHHTEPGCSGLRFELVRAELMLEALLTQGAGRGEAQIREALTATRRPSFTVFEREIPPI